MQIIIPMSGVGKRFIDAGYQDPKPLIEVDGKPIIEHVVNMFPQEDNITFICNSVHLKETGMKNILKQIAPCAKIVEIEPHKLGPVYAVVQIFDMINDDEEVIVNYCDFSKYWEYSDFLNEVRGRNADGAISAYRGFHPHMLGTTNYAFMREKDNWMLEIQEKKPFTDNRMEEYASDGTYYFKKGRLAKKYFQMLIDHEIKLSGEYYVSMVYNLLARDNKSIYIYEIQHMLQWGTPDDLKEYQRWSDYFAKMVDPVSGIEVQKGSLNLIPLAGRGKRFMDQGYSVPKPLIEVSGKPMIVQAASYLPPSEKYIFVCLVEHLQNSPLEEKIKPVYKEAKVVSLDGVTEGQACTCMLGLENEDLESPLLIGACDNGIEWNRKTYEKLLQDETVDAIIWSFRHHPSSKQHPDMYGWLRSQGTRVTGVSVKVPISTDPYNDHAIVGTFYFRKARYFVEAFAKLQEKNIRVNNEFYVDSCIEPMVEAGLHVSLFEVDNYICWGTPDDLQTYIYWQSFFHKCGWHVYDLEKDRSMNKDLVEEYRTRYTKK